jgi:hypothetical protein
LTGSSSLECPLTAFPYRIFVDTSTLQVLQQYGEYIYDGGEISATDRIFSIPNGFLNVEALRHIMFVGQRATFELALSENSLHEVRDQGRSDYLQWAWEVLGYWQECLAAYNRSHLEPFSGQGRFLAERIMGKKFGYRGSKDQLLLRDALLLECKGFLTIDRRLAKNAMHIERETNLKVLEPIQYWELLRPWAPLFV